MTTPVLRQNSTLLPNNPHSGLSSTPPLKSSSALAAGSIAESFPNLPATATTHWPSGQPHSTMTASHTSNNSVAPATEALVRLQEELEDFPKWLEKFDIFHSMNDYPDPVSQFDSSGELRKQFE